MKTSDLLHKAADAIERDGWTVGLAGMHIGGRHCALGAIAVATDAPARRDRPFVYEYFDDDALPSARVRDALVVHLTGVLPAKWLRDTTVFTWNDHSTAEQVIEALRAAAVIEAAKESADDRERVTV